MRMSSSTIHDPKQLAFIVRQWISKIQFGPHLLLRSLQERGITQYTIFESQPVSRLRPDIYDSISASSSELILSVFASGIGPEKQFVKAL